MAPVLGLCLGTCVFTTLIWFAAARSTYWLLPVLALVSVGIALTRALAHAPRIATQRTPRLARDVTGKATAPHRCWSHWSSYASWWPRRSVTPCTSATASGLSASRCGTQTDTRPKRTRWYSSPSAPPSTTDYLTRTISSALLGLVCERKPKPRRSAAVGQPQRAHRAALDRYAGSLPDCLPDAGALGAFAAVRYFSPKPGWAAPLAGVLFAGPFFLQLMADGSQAATCGLAVILPIAAVGADILREKRLASLVILALLVSGLMALYPLFRTGGRNLWRSYPCDRRCHGLVVGPARPTKLLLRPARWSSWSR